MQKFRMKPEEYEVIEYTGHNAKAIVDFFGMTNIQTTSVDDEGVKYNLLNLRVRGFHGQMMLRPGEWLVRGPQKDFYIYTYEAFCRTFEPIT